MIALSNKTPNIQKILFQSITIGTLSTLSILLGLTPNIIPQGLDWSQNAQASENFTDTDLTNYAKAVLDIEPYRQEAYGKIKEIVNPVPLINCDNLSNLDKEKDQVQSIAKNYCNQYTRIVKQNNLTTTKFNQITEAQKQRGIVYQKIQDALLRIQQIRIKSR